MDRTLDWICQECNCSKQAAVIGLYYAKGDVFVARDYLTNDRFKSKAEREFRENLS